MKFIVNFISAMIELLNIAQLPNLNVICSVEMIWQLDFKFLNKNQAIFKTKTMPCMKTNFLDEWTTN